MVSAILEQFLGDFDLAEVALDEVFSVKGVQIAVIS